MIRQEELNQLMKLVLDNLNFTILVDAQGKVAYINQEYANVLGVTKEAAVGKPIEELIPNTQLKAVMKSGQPLIGQLFEMKNGQSVICNRIPLKDEKGRVRGVVSTATFHEIHKIELLSKELNSLLRENSFYRDKIERLGQSLGLPQETRSIIGQAPSIRKAKQIVERIAPSSLSVLITGETGVGKEVFANAIHSLSKRNGKPFIKINCAAIPKELLESELFGYTEGAFSGAAKGGKKGKFPAADKGTVLLDEIGEMPLYLQSKLLRVLQEKEIEPVGSLDTIKVDVRIICSTNRNMEELVREGKFRQDLYYRINVVELEIPPLRQRLEDLPELCDHFIEKVNQNNDCRIKGLRPGVISLFRQYDWPGNVRELEHVIERASVVSSGEVLEVKDFEFLLARMVSHNSAEDQNSLDEIRSLEECRDQAEKAEIIKALARSNGKKTAAAALLNIDRSMLYSKLKKYGLL